MEIAKDLKTVVEKLHQQKPLLVDRYKVESLGVFGSFVRHERKTSSDLDLLVSFREPPSLLTFIELENYLSTGMQKCTRNGNEKCTTLPGMTW